MQMIVTVPTAKAVTSPLVLHVNTYDYVVDPERFKLGHTVQCLLAGENIGSAVALTDQPSPVQKPSDLGTALQKVTADAKESDRRALDDIETATATLKQQPEAKHSESVTTPTPLALAANADFPEFDQCLREALRGLKQRRQLLNSPALSTYANLLTVELEQKRGEGGIYCSSGIELIHSAVVTDEIEMIQLLSALLARHTKERTRLMQTVRLAFSPNFDPLLNFTWRQIWRRLAVAAVFEPGPLPTWGRLTADLSHPQTRVRVLLEQNDAVVDVQPAAMNLHDQIKAGLQILGEPIDEI